MQAYCCLHARPVLAGKQATCQAEASTAVQGLNIIWCAVKHVRQGRGVPAIGWARLMLVCVI
jgi:imidazoleglycerol phosphate synthase glutamine amidotransferase subunit HisH